MTRLFVAGAFVVGFALGWGGKGGHGVVEAQALHDPFMMQWIYTGADGLSHGESIKSDAESAETNRMLVVHSVNGVMQVWPAPLRR